MTERLRLKKNADRRLKAGHLWLYSNEIDTQETPLKGVEPGAQAVIEAANGKPMGIAYVNPNSLICARVVSRDVSVRLDRSLLVHRFNQALALRERLFDKPFYRLVFGEGDLLPGLIVDRFDDVLVVQLNTLGMERLGEEVVAALDKVLKPRAIVFKNDSSGRRQEQLESHVEVVHGELPEQVLLEENGVRFAVPVVEGQKTGWFYDHRANRAWLNGLVSRQAGARSVQLRGRLGRAGRRPRRRRGAVRRSQWRGARTGRRERRAQRGGRPGGDRRGGYLRGAGIAQG